MSLHSFLPAKMLRFALTADMEKILHQNVVGDSDQKLQLVWGRNNPEKISHTTGASYLAMKLTRD